LWLTSTLFVVEDKSKNEQRREAAEQEAKANDAQVKADKEAKEEKARQAKQTAETQP
jgi:membrane protein involved in colicin uptake